MELQEANGTAAGAAAVGPLGAQDLFQLANEQQGQYLASELGIEVDAGSPTTTQHLISTELRDGDILNATELVDDVYMEQQRQRLHQLNDMDDTKPPDFYEPLQENVRPERSNSCGEANRATATRALSAAVQLAEAPPSLACSLTLLSSSSPPTNPIEAINGTAASVSQQNLAPQIDAPQPPLFESNQSSNVTPTGRFSQGDNLAQSASLSDDHSTTLFHLQLGDSDISTATGVDQQQPPKPAGSLPSQTQVEPIQRQSSAQQNNRLEAEPVRQQPAKTRSANSSGSFSSSRFFSSKLNTGSLWSLLSVGSSASMHAINEIASPEAEHEQNVASNRDTDSEQYQRQSSQVVIGQRETSNKQQQLRDFTTRSASNFFNQFKLSAEQQQQQQQQSRPYATQLAPTSQAAEMGNQSSSTRSSRYRFNVKYIGSAMLHKNFTLPMLEWVTKDIRRQTTKAASGVNQRQFTIPIRDIMLEIHPKQLVAISCKDGLCIFVHPMQCVSKYAQLQHSPSSFAYIIRDNKDSPSFCHFFQAKSANRVHEIFMAIREVTTRNQFASLPSSYRNQPVPTADQQASLLRLQKSASSDGSWRSSFDGCGGGFGCPSTSATTTNTPLATSMTPPVFISAPGGSNFDNPQLTSYNQQQQHKLDTTISLQFENSYQFEVMFVKRVKLQCRRVPATFVDDALETLKTFEVPKATQIKGVVTKRIIGASVDERQEYDESSQPPTPGATQSSGGSSGARPDQRYSSKQNSAQLADRTEEHVDRRGSSASLRGQERLSPSKSRQEAIVGRESKSCQQSPAKSVSNQQQASSSDSASTCSISRDDLASTDESIIRSKMRQSSPPPTYTNDFSPYSTITSSDLNERIAAIPVVSGSSVSLDHETRQKLARQVRETIMATAANIKKDVYASGDRLNASNSSKVLDSLSCTGANLDSGEIKPVDSGELHSDKPSIGGESETGDQRRFSVAGSQQQSANNFDLFRRASARHVVKNRTMLLLIGKDELCAISIDKHQMLFNKSFNSIVHCLSGTKNQDHFGLICRDSQKINPQTESYVGFVFKCQSEKVVREIMSALKQVIYSSQHNYHGYNSPYNPLNSISNLQLQFNANSKQQQVDQRQRLTTANSIDSSSLAAAKLSNSQHSYSLATTTPVASLATKRGPVTPLDLNLARQSPSIESQTDLSPPQTSGSFDLGAGAPLSHKSGPGPPPPPPPPPPPLALQAQNSVKPQTVPGKNPIKSMFCDECPLYWFHRLCCDIESLPAEASKAIILRRIDSSLSDREQDEVFTKFSDYKIDSIEDHNEIFMSLLRHLCERKQGKHSQMQSHQSAIAKNASLVKKQSSDLLIKLQSGLGQQQHQLQQQQSQLDSLKQQQTIAKSTAAAPFRGHQRSGSSGGSLAIINASNQQAPTTSFSDASSTAIDNLKRAKNSISVSIENLLKRRSSLRDDQDETVPDNFEAASSNSPLTRTSSFKSTSRENRAGLNDSSPSQPNGEQLSSSNNNLRRSQSTSDYPQISSNQQARQQAATWRDSLTKTLNSEELKNPLANFFWRRGSIVHCDQQDLVDLHNRDGSKLDSKRTSTESLLANVGGGFHSPRHNSSRVPNSSNCNSGQSTPLHLLSGSFWKKSIFDMVQKTSPNQSVDQTAAASHGPSGHSGDVVGQTVKRSRSELRELWKKAIREQITLLKMDKQNQKLMSSSAADNRQDKAQPVTTVADQWNSLGASRDISSIKLNYVPVSWSSAAQDLWNRILKQDPTKKVQFAEVARLVRLGVPMKLRGEVWMFLMNQYQLRHGTSFQPVGSDFLGDANQTYRGLLSQLSTQQHEIFVDIGRTFPSHPYYSQYLSIGQLSLFNLLKAYSLLDRQVGYCQGLSFVAGILLLHVDSEDEAFELMRHLMFNFGLRKQYLPSMEALHLQLYQMTRLLRDHEFQIFEHFDKHDISPSLYAAPWFLTLFASQFPLGFVARLMDLIYLIGIEAIFRVTLTLLAYHRASIIECSSLEFTMDFMRDGLTKIGDKDLVKIFNDAFALDLRNKLIEYEIEYSFYCAEDKTRNQSGGHHHHQRGQSSRPAEKSSAVCQDINRDQDFGLDLTTATANDSAVADATATVIIQHLLSNSHLRSLRSNYSY